MLVKAVWYQYHLKLRVGLEQAVEEGKSLDPIHLRLFATEDLDLLGCSIYYPNVHPKSECKWLWL